MLGGGAFAGSRGKWMREVKHSRKARLIEAVLAELSLH